MNINIAKERISEVLKVDTINSSAGDFLATHVPVTRLNVSLHYDLTPTERNRFFNEEDVYRHEIYPTESHRFVIVKGESGTGKSHLIRWFDAKLESNKPENEVVLLVRRDDNTLKGTIAQLLKMEEVKSLPNKDVYDRLTKAVATVSEQTLKRTIYSYYLVEVKGDLDQSAESRGESVLSRVDKKNLIALLNNSIFEEKMMEDGGPIDRIYSKIESTKKIKESDVNAQFLADDFLIDIDLIEKMQESDSENRVIVFAKKIAQKEELPGIISAYLNQFTDTVIQRTSGLEPGDFKQIFSEIRKELYRQGKNLTLFIEDVTSFTGVNTALLDELVTEHTGMYETEHMCRINSIVGVTEYYYSNYFRDNHKARVTKFITVPANQFDQNEDRLIEFFARYLNTMSLERKVVETWAMNGADMDDYPIHQATEVGHWDYYKFNNKQISLFPFTTHAICWLYNNKLSENRKTPRYIITDILDTYVKEALLAFKEFPKTDVTIKDPKEIGFQATIYQRNDISESEKQRLARLMIIWGNASNDTYRSEDNITYIGGVAEDVYASLNLHVKAGKEVKVVKQDTEIHELRTEYRVQKEKISTEVQDQFASTVGLLNTWVQNKNYKINVGASTNQVIMLSHARDNMTNFLFSYIDWASEGISQELINRIESKNNTFRLISFERQTRIPKYSVYVLPATIESTLVVEDFIKWESYGNYSWDFEGGDSALYRVIRWSGSIREELIQKIKTLGGPGANYYKYAFSINYYQAIMSGAYTKRSSIKNFGYQDLLDQPIIADQNNGHTQAWNNLYSYFETEDYRTSVRNTVLQYFNIQQGVASNSKLIELDAVGFIKTSKDVISQGMTFDEDDLSAEDPVISRSRIANKLLEIQQKIGRIAETEIEEINKNFTSIKEYISEDELDFDSLEDFFTDIVEFYHAVQRSNINISDKSKQVSEVSRYLKQIASSIETIQLISQKENVIDKILLLSRDPLKYVLMFSSLLDMISADIKKVNTQVEDRMKKLNLSGGEAESSKYQSEKQKIDEMKSMMIGAEK